MTPKTCRCGRALSHWNRSGRCRSCAAVRVARDRQLVQRRNAKLSATLNDPARKQRYWKQRVEASRSRLAWCPLEYRTLYRKLAWGHDYGAKAARKMIEDLIAADAARYLATGQLQQSRRAG